MAKIVLTGLVKANDETGDGIVDISDVIALLDKAKATASSIGGEQPPDVPVTITVEIG